MTSRSTFAPIVLIGAARSGTKAARDAMAVALGIPKVPYDVGYVWRHGNDGIPHDRLTPEHIRPRTTRLVESFVGRYADSDGRVIEKTVGNTLRVGFVGALLPEARFVHLIRNGVDVAESTRRQWLEPADYRYLGDKARHFPLRLAPTYGARYVRSLLHRSLSDDGRVATWGPRYPDIEVDLDREPLLTVCARQWTNSVQFARSDLESLPGPSLEVRYEELVAHPRDQLARIAEFAGIDASDGALDAAAETLLPNSAGKGAANLDARDLEVLDREMGDLLTELGYRRPLSAEQRSSE